LNIWKVTPAEAMLTPRSSRISPGARLAAMARNDSRKLSATFSKSTLASIARLEPDFRFCYPHSVEFRNMVFPGR